MNSSLRGWPFRPGTHQPIKLFLHLELRPRAGCVAVLALQFLALAGGSRRWQMAPGSKSTARVQRWLFWGSRVTVSAWGRGTVERVCDSACAAR